MQEAVDILVKLVIQNVFLMEIHTRLFCPAVPATGMQCLEVIFTCFTPSTVRLLN